MGRYSFVAALALTGVALAAAPDISKVNGAISVGSSQTFGNLSTVNGAIRVDDRAVIARARTVIGSIGLGAATSAQSVATVNGSISIGAGGRVTGDISTVNGAIELEHAADISGALTNVNGRIRLDAAHVGSGLRTVTGNIEIGARSRVEGGIWVKKYYNNGFWCWLFPCRIKPSVVVIGPDAIVKGTLRFDHEVQLHVSDTATIGPVEGAKAIIYHGERPQI